VALSGFLKPLVADHLVLNKRNQLNPTLFEKVNFARLAGRGQFHFL